MVLGRKLLVWVGEAEPCLMAEVSVGLNFEGLLQLEGCFHFFLISQMRQVRPEIKSLVQSNASSY